MALIHECLITLARRLRLGNDIAFLDYGCGAGEVVRMAMDRVDTVLHLTGMAHALSERHQDADGYQRINTEGAARFFELAKSSGVKRFIFPAVSKPWGRGVTSAKTRTLCALP